MGIPPHHNVADHEYRGRSCNMPIKQKEQSRKIRGAADLQPVKLLYNPPWESHLLRLMGQHRTVSGLIGPMEARGVFKPLRIRRWKNRIHEAGSRRQPFEPYSTHALPVSQSFTTCRSRQMQALCLVHLTCIFVGSCQHWSSWLIKLVQAVVLSPLDSLQCKSDV